MRLRQKQVPDDGGCESESSAGHVDHWCEEPACRDIQLNRDVPDHHTDVSEVRPTKDNNYHSSTDILGQLHKTSLKS